MILRKVGALNFRGFTSSNLGAINSLEIIHKIRLFHVIALRVYRHSHTHKLESLVSTGQNYDVWKLNFVFLANLPHPPKASISLNRK